MPHVRLFRAVCVALLFVPPLACADETGQRVHRCVGVHGEVVFTGLACNSHELSGISAGSATNPAAPPPADSCPASQQELRDRLVAAIARHDSNTIAGMLRWRGIGASSAGDRLRALRELVRYPLLAIEAGGESGGGLVVRTGSNTTGGVHALTFGVDSEGGCFWLTWY
jgi:hypothetical protein